MDSNGNRLGVSTAAARSGIAQVCLSRIGMAVPSMGTETVCFRIIVLSSEFSYHLCAFIFFRHAYSFRTWQHTAQHTPQGSWVIIFLYLAFSGNMNCGNIFSVLPPILMNHLEKKGTLARLPWLGAPLQVLLCGFCLTFATPMCCALFPQKSSIAVSSLEPELQVSPGTRGSIRYFNVQKFYASG